MTAISPIDPLVKQLMKLPGIGEKSGQRLAFFLLSLPQKEVTELAHTIADTRSQIRYCQQCFNIALTETCHICKDTTRNKDILCVTATPQDVFALERTHEFKGYYHVLGGLISPIDGIHPEMLRITELMSKIQNNAVKEVILAINPTIEGEATTLYLTQLLSRYEINLTKLAHGLPMGADIDYCDELTLQKALNGRTKIVTSS